MLHHRFTAAASAVVLTTLGFIGYSAATGSGGPSFASPCGLFCSDTAAIRATGAATLVQPPVARDRAASQPAELDPERLRFAIGLSEAFQEVARVVGPSVVNINTTQRVAARGNQRPQQPPPPGAPRQPRDPFDDFLERFFGDPFGARPSPFDQQPPPTRDRRSQGSGVVVREDGYIVTNNHVILGVDEIMVRLSNGREYEAQVLGADPETDLAILRIDASGLTPARFGDSDALNPGEIVLALGNSFGLERTVTSGIISGIGRMGMGLATYENFIQTDAAINPGNSGGPLVNLHGEVIGINTAIATRTGGSMGVGFAIPSNMVEHVLTGLIEEGRVYRGWLGVSIDDLSSEVAESLGFADTDGVILTDVTPDGPAAEAGLRHGDVVTAIDGAPMTDANRLRNTVAMLAPGTEVDVEVFRDGRQLRQRVTLGTRPPLEELIAMQQRPERESPQARELGVTVGDLTPEQARSLGMREPTGVIVTGVEPGSVAQRVGIRLNDVILTVGPRDVRNVSEFEAAVAEQDPREGIRLRVRRDGVTRFIVIRTR